LTPTRNAALTQVNPRRRGLISIKAQPHARLQCPSRDQLTHHVRLPRIREDVSSGVRSGVNGIPTFYINDARYDGAWDPESLGAALKLASAAPIGASR
jgi:hypothetical protein